MGLAAAREFLTAGDAEGALAAVAGRDDPEALTVQGRAWMLKARAASSQAGQRWPDSAGQITLVPQEAMALHLLDRAVAAQPDLAEAHLAIAVLLEPGALEWLAARGEARSSPGGDGSRGRANPSPPPDPLLGPDRVLQEYRRAAHADRTSVPIVEAWLKMSLAAGRPEESEVALQELVVRRPRDPDPLVRYGDFLRDVRGDTGGALERYGQALIWHPEDEGIKMRIVGVYLDLADQHLRSREYGAADQRLRDASRYTPSPGSPMERRYVALSQKLAEIRRR